MFATPGAYIRMAPWPPPFTIMGRQGCDVILKMTLSRGRLKCKKGVLVLHHCLLTFGPCIVSRPIRVTSRGTCTSLDPLEPIVVAPLEFEFWLD
jgi:hypothetical protein